MEIRANLVIAANGAMTLGGSSRGLSSNSDRSRFHEIRSWCDAILIGGQTARTEPYASTPVPIYIWSRQRELTGLAAENALARLTSEPLDDLLARLSESGVTSLLCEGGPELISALLAGGHLDAIYLTKTSRKGDGAFFDVDEALKEFREVSRDEVDGEIFRFLVAH